MKRLVVAVVLSLAFAACSSGTDAERAAAPVDIWGQWFVSSFTGAADDSLVSKGEDARITFDGEEVVFGDDCGISFRASYEQTGKRQQSLVLGANQAAEVPSGICERDHAAQISNRFTDVTGAVVEERKAKRAGPSGRVVDLALLLTDAKGRPILRAERHQLTTKGTVLGTHGQTAGAVCRFITYEGRRYQLVDQVFSGVGWLDELGHGTQCGGGPAVDVVVNGFKEWSPTTDLVVRYVDHGTQHYFAVGGKRDNERP